MFIDEDKHLGRRAENSIFEFRGRKMCCLIVEILMLVNGIYTLVAGKLYLTQHLYLRVIGLEWQGSF